jgi:hypothetical protein
MMKHMKRARSAARVRLAAWSACVAAPLLLGACDVKQELLAPQNPGVIDPSSVTTPAAADAVRVGAFSRFKAVTAGGESMWLYGGLLTDEWKSSDTFSQRNETDQRSVQTGNANIATAYAALQQTRGYIKSAIDLLHTYTPDSLRNIGQMYMVAGFTEMTLAENFCSGIPETFTVNGTVTYGPPLTSDSTYKRASFFLDSALVTTTGTDAIATANHQASLIARARVLVDQGNFAAAAALVPVSAVPTTFQYLETFDLTTGSNQITSLNNSAGRYTVSDSFDIGGIIQNALPFASANDPRVPVLNTKKVGFDGTTTLIDQQIWPSASTLNDPVPLVSGVDARLIEAEARLNAGDFAGMMTILNALRTAGNITIGNYKVPAMLALATLPATKSDAAKLFFREKGFWTFGRGQRLSDLRRMVRQYGFTQDQVFPTGSFAFKVSGAIYGTDVNFPVPDNELTNPNFTACIDRKA